MLIRGAGTAALDDVVMTRVPAMQKTR